MHEPMDMTIRELMFMSHSTAQKHGWWDEPRNDGEVIALMHSELSEMLEVLRKDEGQMSKKLPQFTALEEETADLLIRVADYAYKKGMRLTEAIIAKNIYNVNRPYKHGKKF